MGVSQIPCKKRGGRVDETTEPTEPTKPTEKTVDQIFTDVVAKEWYIDDVQYAYDNSLMCGTSAMTFESNGIMTRSQVVQVLYSRTEE